MDGIGKKKKADVRWCEHGSPVGVGVWKAMTESSSLDVPPTVLSALQDTSFPDNITTSSLHPFSDSSDKTVAFLQALLDTTERVAHSVTLHSATVVNDARTVSLLRQQSAGQQTLHLV